MRGRYKIEFYTRGECLTYEGEATCSNCEHGRVELGDAVSSDTHYSCRRNGHAVFYTQPHCCLRWRLTQDVKIGG